MVLPDFNISFIYLSESLPFSVRELLKRDCPCSRYSFSSVTKDWPAHYRMNVPRLLR